MYLLNIQKWERDGLPEIVAILAGNFEMFVEFLFDQRVILYGYGVPHKVLFSGKRKTFSFRLKQNALALEHLRHSNNNLHGQPKKKKNGNI